MHVANKRAPLLNTRGQVGARSGEHNAGAIRRLCKTGPMYIQVRSFNIQEFRRGISSLFENRVRQVSVSGFGLVWIQITLNRADGTATTKSTGTKYNTATPLWESRHFFEVGVVTHRYSSLRHRYAIVTPSLLIVTPKPSSCFCSPEDLTGSPRSSTQSPNIQAFCVHQCYKSYKTPARLRCY